MIEVCDICGEEKDSTYILHMVSGIKRLCVDCWNERKHLKKENSDGQNKQD